MSGPTPREEIAACCKRLRLSRHLADAIASIDTADREQFLLALLQRELEHREASRRMRLIKAAGFYSLKSFDDYVFDEVKLPSGLTVEVLTSCAFVEERRNLILYGNCGTGKTHLSIALDVECCRQGRHVRFTRTAALVNQLSQARKGGELQRFVKQLSKLDLLICDEWGYVPLDREGAQLLFQVVSDCYERLSVVITTNLEFSRWVTVFYESNTSGCHQQRPVGSCDHHRRSASPLWSNLSANRDPLTTGPHAIDHDTVARWAASAGLPIGHQS